MKRIHTILISLTLLSLAGCGDDSTGADESHAYGSSALVRKGIAMGAAHGCAVKADNQLYCWGKNQHGQLGDGTNETHTRPTLVPGLRGVTYVTAGIYHTCAITNDKKLYCWGWNESGQLGDGSTESRATPTAVAGIENVSEVVAGTHHTCATTEDGKLYCWGTSASFGPDSGKQSTPLHIDALTNVTALAAGEGHTCALTRDNILYCWGGNTFGSLGNGTNQRQSTPTQVPGVGKVTQLAAGALHTCAVNSDKRLYCWGNNSKGMLGDGSFSDRNLPTLVAGLDDVTHVAAGLDHTCALNGDKTVACWGSYAYGQLGEGSKNGGDKVAHATPQLLYLEDVAHIACGGNSSFAAMNDGKLYSWGDNSSGQLGDDTTSSRAMPVQVIWLADFREQHTRKARRLPLVQSASPRLSMACLFTVKTHTHRHNFHRLSIRPTFPC